MSRIIWTSSRFLKNQIPLEDQVAILLPERVLFPIRQNSHSLLEMRNIRRSMEQINDTLTPLDIESRNVANHIEQLGDNAQGEKRLVMQRVCGKNALGSVVSRYSCFDAVRSIPKPTMVGTKISRITENVKPWLQNRFRNLKEPGELPFQFWLKNFVKHGNRTERQEIGGNPYRQIGPFVIFVLKMPHKGFLWSFNLWNDMVVPVFELLLRRITADIQMSKRPIHVSEKCGKLRFDEHFDDGGGFHYQTSQITIKQVEFTNLLECRSSMEYMSRRFKRKHVTA